MKLVIILLLSGQRLQSVQVLNVNDIQLNDDSCILYIRKLLKLPGQGDMNLCGNSKVRQQRFMCPSAPETV